MQFYVKNLPIIFYWVINFNFFCSFLFTCIAAENINFTFKNQRKTSWTRYFHWGNFNPLFLIIQKEYFNKDCIFHRLSKFHHPLLFLQKRKYMKAFPLENKHPYVNIFFYSYIKVFQILTLTNWFLQGWWYH